MHEVIQTLGIGLERASQPKRMLIPQSIVQLSIAQIHIIPFVRRLRASRQVCVLEFARSVEGPYQLIGEVVLDKVPLRAVDISNPLFYFLSRVRVSFVVRTIEFTLVDGYGEMTAWNAAALVKALVKSEAVLVSRWNGLEETTRI